MLQIQIDDSELVALGKRISEVAAQIPTYTRYELRWLGDQFVMLERNIAAEKRWTGDTERSIRVLESGDDYIVIGPDLGIAPHAEHLIGGGTPHYAPFANILDWVETKKGEDVDAARRVWHSIAAKGTPAYPFPEMALQQGQSLISESAMRIGTRIEREIVI